MRGEPAQPGPVVARRQKRSPGFTRDVNGAYADSDSPNASLTFQVKRDEGGEIHECPTADRSRPLAARTQNVINA